MAMTPEPASRRGGLDVSSLGTGDILFAALDDAQAAIQRLQRHVVQPVASPGDSLGAKHTGISKSDLADAKAKLEAAERVIHALESAELHVAASETIVASGVTHAEAIEVNIALPGAVGVQSLCDGELAFLEHEDKTRLAFIAAAAASQLKLERTARLTLESSVAQLTKVVQSQSASMATLRRENVALRSRLVSQMAADFELQAALERLHAESSIIAAAGDRNRFDAVISRCEEIASEFERIGGERR